MSAEQGNALSELRLGDYAYYGWGLRIDDSVGDVGENVTEEEALAEAVEAPRLVRQEVDLRLSMDRYMRTAAMKAGPAASDSRHVQRVHPSVAVPTICPDLLNRYSVRNQALMRSRLPLESDHLVAGCWRKQMKKLRSAVMLMHTQSTTYSMGGYNNSETADNQELRFSMMESIRAHIEWTEEMERLLLGAIGTAIPSSEMRTGAVLASTTIVIDSGLQKLMDHKRKLILSLSRCEALDGTSDLEKLAKEEDVMFLTDHDKAHEGTQAGELTPNEKNDENATTQLSRWGAEDDETWIPCGWKVKKARAAGIDCGKIKKQKNDDTKQ
ncbi:unnamed protein product [Prorocentrum cordatum]|uniref:Uncharacterized protein n=1 Tax=Prorocentrum cordatum TaxID=2364126 RepID=A0ABN9XQK7_9DINO|nr:unnamed protein product [Polarella glacialis]